VEILARVFATPRSLQRLHALALYASTVASPNCVAKGTFVPSRISRCRDRVQNDRRTYHGQFIRSRRFRSQTVLSHHAGGLRRVGWLLANRQRSSCQEVVGFTPGGNDLANAGEFPWRRSQYHVSAPIRTRTGFAAANESLSALGLIIRK
jgi:hypothetical protein